MKEMTELMDASSAVVDLTPAPACPAGRLSYEEKDYPLPSHGRAWVRSLPCSRKTAATPSYPAIRPKKIYSKLGRLSNEKPRGERGFSGKAADAPPCSRLTFICLAKPGAMQE